MLFTPVSLGGLVVPNRIVKSAMAEGLCDDEGLPTPALSRLYEKWSAGGVGLAITGMAHVRRRHTYTGHELGLHDDAVIPRLREVSEAVHRHPGKIFAQLCHASPQLPRPRAKELGSRAPSSGFNRTNLLWDRALTDEELRSLARDFGAAARRAREGGVDGVQLHAAHGYLLSRTLSPRHNRRKDRWGGDFEGRLAFLLEVYREVRSAVGADFPVAVKLNAHDGARRGLDLETSLRIGRRLEQTGVDAIEVSAGTGDVGLGFYPNKGEIPLGPGKEFLARNFPFLRPVMPAAELLVRLLAPSVALREESYFFPLARRFAEALAIPVICVGGIRARDDAERMLRESKVAMVSMARPLVREPSLPRRWEQGKASRAACESCNECFVQVGLGQRLRCYRGPLD